MKLIDGLNLYMTEDNDTVQAIALRHLNVGDLVKRKPPSEQGHQDKAGRIFIVKLRRHEPRDILERKYHCLHWFHILGFPRRCPAA